MGGTATNKTDYHIAQTAISLVILLQVISLQGNAQTAIALVILLQVITLQGNAWVYIALHALREFQAVKD